MLIAIVMILSGAALALCFGYAGWQVLYHPEQVDALKYILGNISSTADMPALTATMPDGKLVEYKLSPQVKMFGLTFLFITGMGMLITIARCMSDVGVSIIKALTQPQPMKKKPAQLASTGNSPVNTPPQSF